MDTPMDCTCRFCKGKQSTREAVERPPECLYFKVQDVDIPFGWTPDQVSYLSLLSLNHVFTLLTINHSIVVGDGDEETAARCF